jgi:hypothetical protein
MKHTKQRNIKLGVLIVIIVGALVFFYNEEYTGNPLVGSGKTFFLPELRIAGGANPHNIDDSNIECDIKQTTTVVDNQGKTIKILQSSMLSANPLLDIVNQSDDRPVSVFVVIPKIFCTTDNENITVKKSNLNLSIYGGISTVKESLSYQSNAYFKDGGGTGEQNLGWFSVNDDTIENVLINDKGSYNSELRFDVTGNVQIVYDNAPYDLMTIPINAGDIMTKWQFRNLVDDPEPIDTDGDGITDDYDKCPTEKETFNGYKDNDGCPDSVPTPEPTPIPEVTPTDEEICTSNGKSWDNGVCSPFATEPEPSTIDAEIKFRVDVLAKDGSKQTFQVQDDPSPFDLIIPLTIAGGSGDNLKDTSSFMVEPRIVFDDHQTHQLTTINSSSISIEPIITVKNIEYSLGKQYVNNFIKTNGGVIEDSSVGIGLGSITVKTFEIEYKIPTNVVQMGSSEKLDIRFLVDGDISLKTIVDGKSQNIGNLDISGADFEIKNLLLIKPSAQDTEPEKNPCTDPRYSNTTECGFIPETTQTDECKANEHTEITGLAEDCVKNDSGTSPNEIDCRNNEYIQLNDGVPECILKNTDTPDFTCPDNVTSCIVVPENPEFDDGDSTAPISKSDNTLWYVIGGMFALGIIVYLIKRRN